MPESAPAAMLEIRLLGPFDARLDAQPLPALRTRKGHQLLALLALRHSREVQREWLAATLWPESQVEQAFANLRRTLTDLRVALGPVRDALTAPTPHSLRLEAINEVWVDVAEFKAQLRKGRPDSLREAVALYRGPLLEDWLEEWIIPEREACEQSCLRALETLAREAVDSQDWTEAVRWLKQLTALDPLQEEAQCLLMEALAQNNDFASATLVYREYRELLRREMNVVASPKMTTRFRQIQEQARQSVAPAPSPIARKREEFTGFLPHPYTSFIGRARELEEVLERLSGTRLVTLLGTGGVGKTRLAIRAAERLAPEFPDGVWFADLAPLTDPALIPQTMARLLRLREQPGQTLLEALHDFLHSRRLLIILDNCEHVTKECAEFADSLLSVAPALKILATSRQPLGCLHETVWNTPALSLPEMRHLPPAEEGLALLLPQYEAVRLFIERASEAMPTFGLTEENAPAALRIVRRLDGIPLAIELAAARVRALSVEQVAARLDNRFRLLTRGSPTAQPRQQTLRAAIDWSYNLLSELEKTLLRRLSVFAGRWTLAAAEAVCSDEDAAAPLPAEEILDLLTDLIEKSLVVTDGEVEGERGYRLLETIREYARERLDEAGETGRLCHRHVVWFLRQAQEAQEGLKGQAQSEWMARLDADSDNFRAAVEWALQSAPESALQIVVGITRYWEYRGMLSEGLSWQQRALSSARETPPHLRASGLRCLGRFHWLLGDNQTALEPLETSCTLSESCGDRIGKGNSLNMLGLVVRDMGDSERARILLEASLTEQEALGNQEGIAIALTNLGPLFISSGDLQRSAGILRRACQVWHSLGNRMHEATAICNQGIVADLSGDYETARRLYEESLLLRRALHNPMGIAQSLGNLGMVTWAMGDFTASRAYQEECIAIYREINTRQQLADALRDLGLVAWSEGNYREAESLYTESLTVARETDDRAAMARALRGLGDIARQRRDDHAARAAYRESLTISREVGVRLSLLEGTEGIARMLASSGNYRMAARLFGAASALRLSSHLPLPPPERPEQETLLEAARVALGEESFAEVWEASRALTLEVMVEEALRA